MQFFDNLFENEKILNQIISLRFKYGAAEIFPRFF